VAFVLEELDRFGCAGVGPDVNTDEREAFIFVGVVDAVHRGHDGDARLAPSRPEVDKDDLAFEASKSVFFAGGVFQGEVGGGIADGEKRALAATTGGLDALGAG